MLSKNMFPKELTQLNRWVCWEKKIVDDKVGKIPINPYTRNRAQSNNPSTWSDFDTALECYQKYDFAGLGFMLGDGYFGVDLDDCDEELKYEFIEQLQSYTEYSQSGKGIHIICHGTLPGSRRRVKGIEMYDSARFFVMTGNKIGNFDIVDCSEKIISLYEKYLDIDTNTNVISNIDDVEPISIDDNELLIKASNSRNGHQFKNLFDGMWEGSFPSQSEADMSFATLLAFWTGRNIEQMDRIFRMSGLYRQKWDRKQSGSTYGRITLETAISRTKTIYSNQHQNNENNILINAFTGEVMIKKQENYELTDSGNAQRFYDRFDGVVKYNFQNRLWMFWNGKKWEYDETNQIKTLADIVIQDMRIEASNELDEKIRKEKLRNYYRASQSNGKKAMIEETQHIGNIPVKNDDFDKEDFLLNTLSGVVDLTTGQIMEHDKNFSMSKIIPYEINKEKPELFLKFLNEIFENDQELIEFVQKSLGYTLTGSTREQVMYIAHGGGANGKSVLLDVLSRLFGEYGSNAQIETLIDRKSNSGGASSDLARLNGSRFLTTGENSYGSKINEGLIKQMTGGEKITARFLYGKDFEYYPKFKIWLATNHKPIIRGTDLGIWRRIVSIPFNVTIPIHKRDKMLVQKLLKEMPSILNWVIEGAVKYFNNSYVLPKAVILSNDEYKKEMDVIQIFIDENCVMNPISKIEKNVLYKSYRDWANINGQFAMKNTQFFDELSKKQNIKIEQYGYKNFVVGLTINEHYSYY